MPASQQPLRLTRRGRIVCLCAFLALCLVVWGVITRSRSSSSVPSFDAPLGPLDASKVPGGWAPDVRSAARVAGIPAPVLAAQLYAESKWDPKARSNRGAQGLAQFTPAAWAMYGAGGDPFNPHDAIAAQGRLMRYLKHRADTSGLHTNHIALALAGYNAGFENVVKYHGVPPFPETKNYVDSIARGMGHYADPLPSGSAHPSSS